MVVAREDGNKDEQDDEVAEHEEAQAEARAEHQQQAEYYSPKTKSIVIER